MQPIIEVSNVSKQYRLGQVGTGSLSHDINRWWHRLRGKEDPYLRIGEANDRTARGSSDYVWALQGISFSVQPGEVLGIIGRNGAGKSTLLKILSRITAPSTGTYTLRGRVASLLEVGTGMHPELTGRENIYLNGAILGMRKREIDRKLDAIVDFAGVARYLDTPVKRYSSGMHVRLGFAVAAHLEPDILIVDEVLAVGDAEFQKKCLGKMQAVSSEEGRTVLFVSHNMPSIKTLCKSVMIMDKGKMMYMGDTAHGVSQYIEGKKDGNLMPARAFTHQGNAYVAIQKIEVTATGKSIVQPLEETDIIEFKSHIYIRKEAPRLHFTFVLNNSAGQALFTFSHITAQKNLQAGDNYLECRLPKGFLNIGEYYLDIYLIQDSLKTVFVEKDIIHFEIEPARRALGSWMGKEPGFIKPAFEWQIRY